MTTTTGELWTVIILSATLLWSVVTDIVDWTKKDRKIRFKLQREGLVNSQKILSTFFYVFNESDIRRVILTSITMQKPNGEFVDMDRIEVGIEAGSRWFGCMTGIGIKDVAHIKAVDDQGNVYKKRIISRGAQVKLLLNKLWKSEK